jgi:hypothetical protein
MKDKLKLFILANEPFDRYIHYETFFRDLSENGFDDVTVDELFDAFIELRKRGRINNDRCCIVYRW